MRLKIISDGTNAGTKLIDEDTGEMVHLIQKLTWEADAKDFCTKVTVELINIPVEIVSKAEVELLEFDNDKKLIISKTFEKDIKIVSEQKYGQTFVPYTKVLDAETNKPVGAVQEVKWEANTSETKAKLTKIKMGKDW